MVQQQTSWIPWSLTHNSMIFINKNRRFYDRRSAKKDQISTNMTFSWPGQWLSWPPVSLTFQTETPLNISFGQGTPKLLLTLLKGLKTFIKCSKRTINTSYWAIKAIYSKAIYTTIFYKIYQCVFYVIYKLAVYWDLWYFWNLLMSNFPDHYCLISHAWCDYLEFRIV